VTVLEADCPSNSQVCNYDGEEDDAGQECWAGEEEAVGTSAPGAQVRARDQEGRDQEGRDQEGAASFGDGFEGALAQPMTKPMAPTCAESSEMNRTASLARL